MTSRTDTNGTMTFVHDSDGRMVASYTDILDQDEYRYVALGRRIYARKPYQVPIEYTFDGHDIMLTSLGGSLTKFQNGPGIDNKLGSRSGTLTPSYYLSDHLGTTTATVTPSGGFSSRPALDSFGNVEGDFTGREYDTFNSLYYYRARMYDPKLGRFISEDPIGFAGGDVNLYGYVWNSPTNWSDPTGLDPFKLPATPGTNGSNLPQGWRPDTSHKYPNGERWVSPNGKEGLDFHKGRPGAPGFEGKDHWHKLKPKQKGSGFDPVKTGGRKGGHYLPDDEVDLDPEKFSQERGRIDLRYPTNEEIRLQIEAATNMEAFWTKIFVGSAVGGACILVPGLLPGLVPSLGPALPRFPQFVH